MESKIGNAIVIHKNNDKRIDKIFEYIKKAEKRNELFFGFKCPKYKIKIVYSTKEFDENC